VAREPEQSTDGDTPVPAATHVVDTSANATCPSNDAITSNVSTVICDDISGASISATAEKENSDNVCDDGVGGQRSAQKMVEGPVMANLRKGAEQWRDSECGRPTVVYKVAAHTLSEETLINTKGVSTMLNGIASDYKKSSDDNTAGQGETASDQDNNDHANADIKFDDEKSDDDNVFDACVIGTEGEAGTESATNNDVKDGGDSHNRDVSAPSIVMDQTANKDPGSEGNRRDCRKEQHAVSSLFFSTAVKSDLAYKCFICNADLSRIQTGLKGRMNHIKRCGKKYGIRAGDGTGETNLCDTEVFGLDANTSTVSSASVKSRWHENAETELAMAIETQRDGKHRDPSSMQQPINSYFARPVRSLDKVLLQGARNVAKKQKIAVKCKASSASSTSTARGRRGGGGWKRRREAPTSCPSHKQISNTSVLVDAFQYANPALPQTHFLSHFHSDHYGGLTKHWSGGIIYCSAPTATLVNSELGVEKKYLHPLPMNTVSVVDANGKPVSVTLLDANHCPGAVMFLFELPSGKKILHVGDFRWDRHTMLSLPQLAQLARGANSGVRLDDLYLDTTYCDEKYDTMPTQKKAIAAAVDMAVKEMKDSSAASLLPDCIAPRSKSTTLFLFGSYTIGKEKLYLSCAMALGLRIYVEPRKLRILSALNFSQDQMNMFTTIKSEAQIWVVPMGHCSFKHLDSYLAEANASVKGLSGGYASVVAFRPTGWSFSASNGNLISTRRSGNKTIHGVPYSEHSSFAELVDCLLCLRPKRIVPTVSVSTSQAQIELLLQAAHAREEEEQYQ